MNSSLSRRSFLAGIAAVALGGASAALLTACEGGSAGSTGLDETATAPASSSAISLSAESAQSGVPVHVEVPNDAKVLLVFFSRPGMNNDGMGTGKYRDLAIGYTKTVAGYIEDELGCDTFEIKAAKAYPHDYRETVERNVREEENETYPKIANISECPPVDGYDVIIMGSPVWNSQSPMIMRTFLRNVDLSGKIVLPFTTYDMSGLGSVPEDYAELAPQAQVSDGGLAVYECDAEKSKGRHDTHEWLAGLGLVEA